MPIKLYPIWVGSLPYWPAPGQATGQGIGFVLSDPVSDFLSVLGLSFVINRKLLRTDVVAVFKFSMSSIPMPKFGSSTLSTPGKVPKLKLFCF